MPRGRLTVLAGVTLAGLAPVVMAAPATTAPREAAAAPLVVVLATWRAEALGRSATGAAGWVTGCDGTLRLDLAAGSGSGAGAPGQADPWAALLSREGRGWTLVAPPDSEGLYGAWDREWRPPPVGLAALARGATHWAAGDRPPRGRRAFVLAAIGADGIAEDLVARPCGLRRELVTRARGGGGRGEIVRMAPQTCGGVRVRSSRRPGSLVVTPRERRPTSAAPGEVFLPWWSLGEVLALPPPVDSGTSGEPAR